MSVTLKRGVISLLNVKERVVAKEMVIGAPTPESFSAWCIFWAWIHEEVWQGQRGRMASGHWSKWTWQAACLSAHLLWTAKERAAVADPVAPMLDCTAHPQHPTALWRGASAPAMATSLAGSILWSQMSWSRTKNEPHLKGGNNVHSFALAPLDLCL